MSVRYFWCGTLSPAEVFVRNFFLCCIFSQCGTLSRADFFFVRKFFLWYIFSQCGTLSRAEFFCENFFLRGVSSQNNTCSPEKFFDADFFLCGAFPKSITVSPENVFGADFFLMLHSQQCSILSPGTFLLSGLDIPHAEFFYSEYFPSYWNYDIDFELNPKSVSNHWQKISLLHK